MLKKFLAAATAIVMAASLVACGSGSTPSSNDTPAATKAEEDAAGAEGGSEGAGEAAGAGSYKIGLMISPLATREEYYRTAEMLIEQYGADKFVMDVYPEDPQNEQEVTISKALNIAMDPDVILFDEPTSALDPELTGEVLKVISGLRESGTTMLIVTHEIMFAREIADKVIFLDGGKILEYGDAKAVIDNPTEQRTKEFMDKILKA